MFKGKLQTVAELRRKARQIRISILTMLHGAGSGHAGGSLSIVEILTALYYSVMRHDPANPHWKERDRFLLCKGHAAPAQYAVLADCGYFPKELLATLRQLGSPLQGHPHMLKTVGLEASTGSLGQGLSIACGIALGGKLRAKSYRVFALLSDGELQEGQTWEALLFANKYRLDNLTAIIDRNFLQTDGFTEDIMPLEPLSSKWEAFGWHVEEIDGHDIAGIVNSLTRQPAGKPRVVIARTVKGKGVSFMENRVEWHGAAPDDEQYARAMEELNGA